MIQLKIDGVVVPLAADITLPKTLFAYDSSQLHDIESTRQGRELTLTIPLSSEAATLLGSADECNASESFNASSHRAEVEVDGVEIISGVAHLMAMEYDKERLTSYRLRIREGAGGWADRAAITDLAESDVEYRAVLNGQTIAQSWAEDSAVKFLPVKYDSYEADKPHSVLTPREKILSVADYHPFLSVEQIIRAIFASSDYTLCSRWLDSPMARSLHISGAYSQQHNSSVSRLNAIAGFAAGRESSATARANAIGIVFATPTVVQNSLGNFVDTCDPEKGEGLYDNAHTLTFDDRGITFTPSVAMTAGFDIRLKYSTPFRIASLTELNCFNRVVVDPTCDISFTVANPFKEVRESIAANTVHSLYIFDFHSEGQYRYRWVAGQLVMPWQSVTARQSSLTSPAIASIRLVVEEYVSGEWQTLRPEQWGLYQGYVEQIGSIDIEVELSTAPETLSPDRPKVFDSMYIAGGEPDWELTLHPECRLKPRFSATPAIGSQLTFSSVARHAAKQTELLKAVAQMFNLAFYTDEQRQEVYMEPYDELFASQVVDWREAIVLSKGFRRCDAAQEVAQIRRLSYLSEGGGAVARYNTKQNTTVGVWSAKTPSHIARQGVEHNQNGLFCPTLTTTEVLLRAPSAGFLSVGDRDGDSVEDNRIRVVCYKGLIELPDGESWGFPATGNSYPFAAFHYPHSQSEADGAAMVGNTPVAGGNEGFTLCFEDRDNEQGLHSHYRARYRQEALGEKITLGIHLSVEQMRGLFSPRNEVNLLSLFRLAIGGESFVARIDAIESYDTDEQCAMIRFMKIRG